VFGEDEKEGKSFGALLYPSGSGGFIFCESAHPLALCAARHPGGAAAGGFPDDQRTDYDFIDFFLF
jgi:hypothetical protein